MSMAPTVGLYLCDKDVHYELLGHPYSFSALDSAHCAHINPAQMAKALLMKNSEGHRYMLLTRADKKIQLSAINRQLSSPLHFVAEKELADIFQDCEPGAIPPLAQAYGLDCLVDYELLHQDDIYLEAGDHLELIHLTGAQFQYLMKDTPPLFIIGQQQRLSDE